MALADIKPIQWIDGKVRIIDQTRLPAELVYVDMDDYVAMAEAICQLRVRGAPQLGIAAAYGLALGARRIKANGREEFLSKLSQVSKVLASTRPTAVNLFYALRRMESAAGKARTIADIQQALLDEAKRIADEEDAANRQLGKFGAELVGDGATILTHCNAGALATGGYGTALGVIYAAREAGKGVQVFADESRPLLQGSRLTAWELMQVGIPVTLITDSMYGHFLISGKIDLDVVGADRIAANGDVANKIGTYSVAVLAMENGVPFYVAAPVSTVDLSLASGDQIPIEERSPEEVTHLRGVPIAPAKVKVANPAFDVTPHHYVTAIITEKGVIREPYQERLRRVA
ncbi:MAG: S-methyl-5-thioribose-1-phosphate isomerase [Chloroflexi bacterium]|nr:S-methyl-5-thioribose-1-phosphate isomerase [Chloroflexota bacterium]